MSMKLIFIPHVGKGGGAALYNKQFLSAVNDVREIDVEVWGEFSKDYDGYDKKLDNINFSKICLPYYKGVGLLAVFYWLASSIVSLCRLGWLLRDQDFSDSTIVLSSSILLPWALLIKKNFSSCRIVVLVQENWRFDGVLGGVFKKLYLYVDVVVSITTIWSNYAAKNGIKSHIYPNIFSVPEESELDSSERPYDFIYVGGGGTIKGFEDFLSFCEKIFVFKAVSILALGCYSEDQIKRLSYIKKSSEGSKLMVEGYVENIQAYMGKSKVLLLPIQAPHFCRPAVEAGFYHIPFVIKYHDERQDFLGLNCLEYNTVEEMVLFAVSLLDKHDLREEMGNENNLMAHSFTDSGGNLKCSLQEVILYG